MGIAIAFLNLAMIRAGQIETASGRTTVCLMVVCIIHLSGAVRFMALARQPCHLWREKLPAGNHTHKDCNGRARRD